MTLTQKAWMVLILLLAAAFRMGGVVTLSPPGLEHDEVANWLIDRAILDEGQHGVYFEEAYGHEAGFHYVQAASVALLGDHALALRYPAMMAGVLLVAIGFALGRRLFGVEVALMAAAFSAVILWPIFYSRLGLRAISLPVVAGLSLIAFWHAWEFDTKMQRRQRQKEEKRRFLFSPFTLHPSTLFLLSGLLAGLSVYTYMAARAVPIFYAVWFGYLALFHWPRFRANWRGLVGMAVVASAVALPLFVYLQTNPGAEFRVSEVDAPLRALLAGDVGPVLSNFVKIVGMFGVQGDPLWRQNVAFRPVYDPITAILFYAGVALALWRWRDARYAFLLLWTAVAAIPSLVTVDAPSSIRLINMLLTVTLFPALVLHIIPRFSTVIPWLSTKLTYFLAGTLVLTHIWWTAGALFHTWPSNDEVRFVWQAALTETAAHLDADASDAPTAIGGWSPATMDPPTMALTLRRDDIPLRYFGSDSMSAPITTVILPAAPDGDSVRVTHPAIRTLAPLLADELANLGRVQTFDSFVRYDVATPIAVDLPISAEVAFSDQLQLLGYQFDPATNTFLTAWQVLTPTADARRFFLHAVDEQGHVVTQHDGNDAPAMHWQAGDLLLQVHPLDDIADATAFRLGVYDPSNGARLITAEGVDYVELEME